MDPEIRQDFFWSVDEKLKKQMNDQIGTFPTKQYELNFFSLLMKNWRSKQMTKLALFLYNSMNSVFLVCR